jgi:ABC-type ATPase involved in cell division
MPWATVFDNVWLPLRLAGAPKPDAAKRVRQALREVGLSRFEGVLPSRALRRHEDARLHRPRHGHRGRASSSWTSPSRRWTR